MTNKTIPHAVIGVVDGKEYLLDIVESRMEAETECGILGITECTEQEVAYEVREVRGDLLLNVIDNDELLKGFDF